MIYLFLKRFFSCVRGGIAFPFCLLSIVFASFSVQADTFGDWRIQCEEQRCQAQQQLFVGEGEQRSRVLSASVMKLQDQLVMQLVFPLGVDLRPGIATRIDEAQEQQFAFSTCVKDGCVVLLPLNEGFLSGLKAGNTLKAGFRPFGSDQTLVVELSLKGFTKASSNVR